MILLLSMKGEKTLSVFYGVLNRYNYFSHRIIKITSPLLHDGDVNTDAIKKFSMRRS